MILVDSNVLMYSSGAEHANKAPAVRFLKQVAAGEIEATVDAEVLQEIIHRYRALRRWPEGRQVYALARKLFPEALAITGAVMDHAKLLADDDANISARDAVHAAVVATYRLDGICTFDDDFDRIPGCRRTPL
jgi:predicted nucleic acid-binding protein